MCSTPRPKTKTKTKAKGKAGTGGSLLSNLSAEARNSFAERANVAQERRYQMTIKSEQAKHQRNASTRAAKTKDNQIASKSQKSLGYWLLNANIKEIVTMLFLGTSERA